MCRRVGFGAVLALFRKFFWKFYCIGLVIRYPGRVAFTWICLGGAGFERNLLRVRIAQLHGRASLGRDAVMAGTDFVRGSSAVLGLGLLLFSALPVSALPLEDAVRGALQTNPDIGIVAESRRAITHELNQARGGYLPRLDLRTAYGAEYTNDRTTRGRADTFGNGRSQTLGTFQSSLTLTQMLFDGDETWNEVQRQKSRLVAASRRVRETSEFIALDAVEAYLESLRQRELTQLASDNVDAHRETVGLVEAKASGGAATVADIQQARSRLAASESTLTESRTRLRDADATYTRIVGENPKELIRPLAPTWALPISISGAVDIALQNNP